MSNKECTCKQPNYDAFTGRCTVCGGFHNKDLEMQFDYKSRRWEAEQSRPVCVACINESRSHQITGAYEHICGKQAAASDTQLPAEWLEDIEREAEVYANIQWGSKDKFNPTPASWDDCKDDYIAGETAYATKAYQAQQEIESLKRWKEEQMAVCAPLFDYGQSKEANIPLGASIVNTVLERCKRYDQVRTLIENVYMSYNSGLTIDPELIDDIKTFLNEK